jgi:hypothetical protein
MGDESGACAPVFISILTLILCLAEKQKENRTTLFRRCWPARKPRTDT